MTEPSEKSGLLPCPMPGCVKPAHSERHSFAGTLVRCSDEPSCLMSYFSIPRPAWQSLPRQSEELRAVVAEMQSLWHEPVGCNHCYDKKADMARMALRLSRIADKGECEKCKERDAVKEVVKMANRLHRAEADSRTAPPAGVWIRVVSGDGPYDMPKVLGVVANDPYTPESCDSRLWQGPFSIQDEPKEQKACTGCITCNSPDGYTCCDKTDCSSNHKNPKSGKK